jgi:hypothetical protein
MRILAAVEGRQTRSARQHLADHCLTLVVLTANILLTPHGEAAMSSTPVKPSSDKLKVLWQKGRNCFSTFFVELGDVRKLIGDDRAFASWCITDLRIGVDALFTMSKVLKKTDAARVQGELAGAREADRADRRAKTKRARGDAAMRSAASVNTTKPEPPSVSTTKSAKVNTTTTKKPRTADRHREPNRDRHSPGYMREYMRQRRAEKHK